MNQVMDGAMGTAACRLAFDIEATTQQVQAWIADEQPSLHSLLTRRDGQMTSCEFAEVAPYLWSGGPLAGLRYIVNSSTVDHLLRNLPDWWGFALAYRACDNDNARIVDLVTTVRTVRVIRLRGLDPYLGYDSSLNGVPVQSPVLTTMKSLVAKTSVLNHDYTSFRARLEPCPA